MQNFNSYKNFKCHHSNFPLSFYAENVNLMTFYDLQYFQNLPKSTIFVRQCKSNIFKMFLILENANFVNFKFYTF